jgi:hypothetical protein
MCAAYLARSPGTSDHGLLAHRATVAARWYCEGSAEFDPIGSPVERRCRRMYPGSLLQTAGGAELNQLFGPFMLGPTSYPLTVAIPGDNFSSAVSHNSAQFRELLGSTSISLLP